YVLGDRREPGPATPLALDAEHVDHVEFTDHGIEVGGRLTRPIGGVEREQGGRRYESDMRTQGRKRLEIGPGHSRVADVADYPDLQRVELAEMPPQGERVQQRLGGMLVGTVTAVADGNLDPVRPPMCGPG